MTSSNRISAPTCGDRKDTKALPRIVEARDDARRGRKQKSQKQNADTGAKAQEAAPREQHPSGSPRADLGLCLIGLIALVVAMFGYFGIL